jgi:DNA processing protein
LANRIIESKDKLHLTEKLLADELAALKKIDARIISFFDADYPANLKNIYYPPILLYVKGNLHEADKNSVSIVGTRNPTSYGKINTEKFARELSEKGLTIVSGMARGIDTISHSAALKAGGRTIAIVGSGLDVIYPPENKKLFDEISEKGAVISEYPPGTQPDAQNFPKRNRIISGISLGTLIIETRINGGAMQTAAFAIDQNKEVFALPGNINSIQSEGTNSLIQRGEAKLVLTAEDILEELNLSSKSKPIAETIQKSIELNLFESKLLHVVNVDPIHIDEIAGKSEMNISDCLANLLTLEFKGMVKQLPGKMFVRI